MWVKDINFKHETLKQLADNIGSTIQDIGVGKDILNKTSLVLFLRPRTDNRTLVK